MNVAPARNWAEVGCVDGSLSGLGGLDEFSLSRLPRGAGTRPIWAGRGHLLWAVGGTLRETPYLGRTRSRG